MYTVHYYNIHDVSIRISESYSTKQQMQEDIDWQASHGYKVSHIQTH